MLALILSAVAVGLGNLGAAISIGISGNNRQTKLKVGVIFGLFEAGMPVAGLLLGHGTSQAIGKLSGYIGGSLLIVMGLWQFAQRVRAHDDKPTGSPGISQLIVTAFALSMDNLVVGFALGARHTNLTEAIAVFAAVTVTLSFAGLEIGKRLSAVIEVGVDYLAALVLVTVGLLVTLGAF